MSIPAPRLVMSAAGERELESLSRTANLFEATAVCALAIGAVWIGPMVGGARGRAAGSGLVIACVVWAICCSPWVHGDTRSARGLANSFSLRAEWRTLGVRERWIMLGTGAALLAMIASLMSAGWSHLLIRIGLRRALAPAYDWLAFTTEGRTLGLVVTATVLLVGGMRLVRWDTWLPSLRAKLLPAVLLGAAIVAFGSVWSDAMHEPWPRTARALERGVHYLVWGLLQQAVVLGWLNIRLRRGIQPGFGSRALVALLCGGIFALAHAPNMSLAGVAGAGVGWLSWLSQRRGTRNMVAAGVFHALLGLVYAACAPGSMRVGPL